MKYDIFFNFRIYDFVNMVFPSIAENQKKYDIYVECFYENVVFHAVLPVNTILK